MNVEDDFASLLKNAYELSGLSLEKFARKYTTVTAMTVSNWMSGRHKPLGPNYSETIRMLYENSLYSDSNRPYLEKEVLLSSGNDVSSFQKDKILKELSTMIPATKKYLEMLETLQKLLS